MCMYVKEEDEMMIPLVSFFSLFLSELERHVRAHINTLALNEDDPIVNELTAESLTLETPIQWCIQEVE